MAEQQQRVVAAFDDPDDAEAVKDDLAQRGEQPEQDAGADAEVAFASTDERGDSAERPPDTTVAVEVEDPAEAAAVARELEEEDVKTVEVDPADTRPRPANP